jgi:hypothetical protein
MKNKSPKPALFLFLLTLSACNVFGGLDSPSGDLQHLDAARACLDDNDFPCALEHYRALGNSYADTRINEIALTQLAQAGVFSFADLISSLGTSLGNGRTFSAMAELIASRGVATAANRVLIQQTYTDNGLIAGGDTASKLRAFSRFISALSMYNTVLAGAAGGDGILTASDISPGNCATILGDCAATSGMPDSSPSGSPTNLNLVSGWVNEPSLDMLWIALSAIDTEAAIFTGSQNGILSSINDLLSQAPPAASYPLKRQQLILMLGLQ